jgi:tRNA(Ile)-lysidine synthase
VLERVSAFMARTSMANAGEKIGVAVSGGADSVFLLHLLVALRARFGYSLSVLHINHRLRGAESDADQNFVAALAAAHGLPFFVESAPVCAGENLEQAARSLRRAFFARLRQEGVVSRIALGHTLSDQAETVLLRLFRGTGLRGLAAMRPITPDALIRPLLALTRDEVRAAALAEGLSWREDSSNQDPNFRRNLLRLEILPKLRASFHPRIEQVLAGTARLAQAEEDYWAGEVAAILPRVAHASPHGLLVDVTAFQALHLAVQRRVMRAALELVGARAARVEQETDSEELAEASESVEREFRETATLRSVDSAHIEAMIALCSRVDGHDRLQVPGIDALRSFDRLRLASWPPPADQLGRASYALGVPIGQRVGLPFEGAEVQIDVDCRPGAVSPHFAETAEFDADAWRAAGGQGGVVMRNWQPGDAYTPRGYSGSAKIKTLFQQERVYLWQRKHWPVMEIAGAIGWALRFGAASHLVATERSTAVVRLTYYKKVR